MIIDRIKDEYVVARLAIQSIVISTTF